MTTFIRQVLYALNFLALLGLLLLAYLFVYSIVKTTNHLSSVNSSLEKSYNEAMNNYRNTIIFILKNNFPRDVIFLNSASNANYNLPPVKYFSEKAPAAGAAPAVDHSLNFIHECYNNKCIWVAADKMALTEKVLKEKAISITGSITIPIGKTKIFEIGIRNFVATYKNQLLILSFSLSSHNLLFKILSSIAFLSTVTPIQLLW